MFTQTGRFETRYASKYLQQLCKHFAHKVEVTYDTMYGNVAFPFGKAVLHAKDGALVAKISGTDETALARARSVIDVHLRTFAFREEFQQMDWCTETGLPPQR
ncbi:DUF2218 domain-containing protein [Phaeobacter gallaeciensis]|uniref:DUF2218 domain-containing protein n=1 Tax=Phaeobacter gallaeciensis TaxID=60890 RepID=A0AAC9ZD64_9RHOB|nr:DUF2218 domain-containing protein [Phaeobacter gallaeciensis]AHD11550.1 Uncharacterized protein in bacteria [Phaeobacter gallaeciensis DSM 26640]ATE94814.1 putative protein in bacteria [Phaeobacter gallaeciensis]ATE99086.1 putative protein in bacteria [Phaeobacter gallaeciensis]ATF03478.1 putative protein in bacteria [Phaeobacter gallaeciensis]ATF07858.1 putative protein in bacteria [Phaeobacter gallaeciensis]